MSTQTVFQEGNQPQEQKDEGVHQEENTVDFADQLSQILNEEGKPKYKDVETALAALKASQEYIPTIKQEKEELEKTVEQLRVELSKRTALQEVVDKLKQEKEPQETMQEQPTNTNQALTPEQIQEMLEQYVPQILEKRQEQTVAQQNILAVDKKLKEFYGENVETAVKTKAESLGLSIQDLEALSAKSPASVLELLGVKETKPAGRSLQSSVVIPPVTKPSESLKPDKSMLLGATGKEQAEYLRSLRENVLRKHGYNI